MKNGDIITIDAKEGILSVEIDDKEFEKRKKTWRPRQNMYQSGELWKYAQLVGSALNGAVTHPGAKKEKFCYADI